jgi:hypothetical protein
MPSALGQRGLRVEIGSTRIRPEKSGLEEPEHRRRGRSARRGRCGRSRSASRARTPRTSRRAEDCGSMGPAAGGRRDDGRLPRTSTRIPRTAKGSPDASHPARWHSDSSRPNGPCWGRAHARPRLLRPSALPLSYMDLLSMEGVEPSPSWRVVLQAWFASIGLSRYRRTDGEPSTGRERGDHQRGPRRAVSRRCPCQSCETVGTEGVEPVTDPILNRMPLPLGLRTGETGCLAPRSCCFDCQRPRIHCRCRSPRPFKAHMSPAPQFQWFGDRDSNPDLLVQSQPSVHWTIPEWDFSSRSHYMAVLTSCPSVSKYPENEKPPEGNPGAAFARSIDRLLHGRPAALLRARARMLAGEQGPGRQGGHLEDARHGPRSSETIITEVRFAPAEIFGLDPFCSPHDDRPPLFAATARIAR